MTLKNYPVVTGEEVVKTYVSWGQGYKCASDCKSFLEDNGFDRIYVESEDGKFPFLNVFANFAFYSGFLRKNVNISEGGESLKKIKKKIIPGLGLKGKIVPASNGHGAIVRLKKGGAYMARVLESMGLPRYCGPKARMESLGIPTYRQELFDLATSGVLDKDENEIIRKIEYDSAAVLFSTRTSVHKKADRKKDYWYSHFFARPTKKEAENLAKDNLKLINFAVPEMEIREEDIGTTRLKSGSYVSSLHLNGRNLECILDGNRSLIKFSPELQKHYSFKLDFEPVEI
ncbi:MAG: hypothetical protein V3U72_02500 [Candidatus Aenigmarchaeota archaeon]